MVRPAPAATSEPTRSPAGDRGEAVARAPTAARPLRVALAHDWLVGYRGGEAVLAAIARALAAGGHRVTRLYAMFDDGRPLDPAVDPLPRRTAALSRPPGASGPLRRWLLPLYPAAVADLSRALARDHAAEPIDLLISTSSAAVKGLRPPRGVPHLCYCHAPARYIWSQTADYARADAAQGVAGLLRGLGLRACAPALRRWDRATAVNVSRFLANSRHTADQIRACYGRDADVLHPPVRTEYFTPDPSARRDEHWLCVGALEPYKRVDLAIAAAALAGRRLLVVGTGSQEARLRRAAGPHVTFAGRLDDGALLGEYRRAALLLFPQLEDFGIVAVEAQACGLPVAAFARGGALDTVLDGVTGALFHQPTPEALARAAAAAPTGPVAERACRENAERFGQRAFAAGIAIAIAALAPSA